MTRPTSSFLTEAESLEVDQALLSSKDKFSTRVAIYSLRVLQAMAPDHGGRLEAMAPEQITRWLEQHQSNAAELMPGLDQDAGFSQFFSQLVLSSQKPLTQAAEAAGKSIDELRVPDIIAWFELRSKQQMKQG